MRKYIFKSSLRFQNGLKNSLILQFSLQLHAKQYFEIFFLEILTKNQIEEHP